MPSLIPSLSFERISPSAFIYEVIGHSELSTIALPSATSSPSVPNQHLRLLIRLKWILGACLCFASRDGLTSPDDHSFNIAKETVIRILTYACDISGSVRLDQGWNTGYTILRRTTLQLLSCAVRLIIKLEPTWISEEIDWTRTQIEEMVQGWSKGSALSLAEASLIKELLETIARGGIRSLASPLGSQTRINAAFDDLLGQSLEPYSNKSQGFWTIHDWILSRDYETSHDTQQLAIALALYREVLSKFRGRPDHHYSFPLATYMLEEFALRINPRYQLLPHEQLIAENQVLSDMMKVSAAEATAFSESFPQHVSLLRLEPVATNTSPSPTSLAAPTSLSTSFISHNRSTNQSPIPHSPVPPRKALSTRASNQPAQSSIQTRLPSPRRDFAIHSFPSAVADVRAYEYPTPVELPSRKSTHRPQQSLPPTIEIDSGLEVVQNSEFNTTSEFEKMMRLPQLGLRRPSLLPEGDSQSISNFSSIGSVSSKTKRGLFSRLGVAKRVSLSPLPVSLEFCFSTSATQILFWCRKNPDTVIRMQHPYEEAERFEMFVPDTLPSHMSKPQTRSIRLFSAAHNTAIALVHIEESRWLYSLHDAAFQPLASVPDTLPPILSIALSNDGTTIAIGCGHFVLIYRMLRKRLTGPWKLDPNHNLGPRMVRLHKLSFSPDTRRLISAVQVEHSTHKHAVFISIWSCSEEKFRLDAQLDPVYLTVGYSDDTGISAVYLTGQSDSLAVQQAFLTASLSKSYPSILPIASGMRNQHLDIADKRIDGAAQCPNPTSPYLCAIRSGRNKVFLVDVRNGVSEKVADFSSERKGLHLRHEHVALGMQGPDILRVLWRTADENLILKSMLRGKDGKWVVQGMELGTVYRQAAGLL